jgi:hypothetical protein
MKRCFYRSSLVGIYLPAEQVVTLPFDKGNNDPMPTMTLLHELTHRDLTEKTLAGLIDRLLAVVSGDSELDPDLRRCVDQTFNAFFDRASLLHEGVATYTSGINIESLLKGSAAGTWDSLPDFYRSALTAILKVFPDLDADPPPSVLIHGIIVTACAKVALNVPDLQSLMDAAPRSWTELSNLLLATNQDERFNRLLDFLADSGRLDDLIAFMEERFLQHLGSKSVQNHGDVMNIFTARMNKPLLEVLQTEVHQFLLLVSDAVESKLHEMWPEAGIYRSLDEKLTLFRSFISFCNNRIQDRLGRPVFASIQVATSVSLDAPKVKFAFTGTEKNALWLSIDSEPLSTIQSVRQWLRQVARVSVQTKTLIIIQAREYINPREQTIVLSKGETLEFGESLLTLDPWINYVGNDGRTIRASEADNLRKACGGIIRLKLRNSASDASFNKLVKEIAACDLHAVWHNNWEAGIAAAEGIVDFTFIPGLRIFYLDSEEITSDDFTSAVRHLARRAPVHVSATEVFQGEITPFVVWHENAAMRWSILLHKGQALDLFLRLESELGSRLIYNRSNFLEDVTDPLTRFAVRYFYHLGWDERVAYVDAYEQI